MAQALGCGPKTLRAWCNQSIGAGRPAPEVPANESLGEENRRLRQELAEARRANEILKKASVFFAAELEAPHDEMIRFVDMNRDRFGVEAICRVMPETDCGFITSQDYRAAKSRPASARALRDRELIPEIKRVHEQNYRVYGGTEDVARDAQSRLGGGPGSGSPADAQRRGARGTSWPEARHRSSDPGRGRSPGLGEA
ncbi:hypothetical protein M3E19_02800 [Kocuria rhizophila]|nr:hypothetical protein [Kocuria rhizophila]MCT1544947.1 hypothetical protein [Kocuria rhizophila]MCT2171152.1 hypothetical protein [Kocuria rhizophila]